MTTTAVRYLTVPADADVTALAEKPQAPISVSFGQFILDTVLVRVPWSTPNDQDTFEALRKLVTATCGEEFELREVDHAALVQAMTSVRAQLTGPSLLAFSGFFAAVARAATTK